VKKASPEIYILIASMSPSKRAYFRKYCQKYFSGKNIALQLFGLFEQYTSETKIKTQERETLIKQSFLKSFPGKDFVKEKHQLFELLIDVLRKYSHRKHEENYFFEEIERSEIMIDHNLKHIAIKKLNKALIKAQHKDLPYIELLLHFKINLALIKSGTVEDINKNIENQKLTILNIQQKLKYAELYDQVYQIYKHYGVLTSKDFAICEQLKSLEVELDTWDLTESQPKTLFNKLMIHQLISHIVGENEKAVQYSEQAYLLAKDHFHLFNGREIFVFGLISNIIHDSLLGGNTDKFIKYIEDFSTTADLSNELILYNKVQHCKLSFIFSLINKDWVYADETIKIFDGIEHLLSSKNKLILYELLLNIQFARRNYKNAFLITQKLINCQKLELSFEIEILRLEFIQLVLYYEMNDFDLIDYRLRSMEHKLKTDDAYQSVRLSNCLKWFKLLVNTNNSVEKKSKFIQLRDAFTKSNLERERSYFQLSSWAESYIKEKADIK